MAGLKAVGANVFDMSGTGDGFPDLCVGYHGANYLIEIKVPGKRSNLTEAQREWWSQPWHGPRAIVETLQEAFSAIGCRARVG